jgi:hypothetical protein
VKSYVSNIAPTIETPQVGAASLALAVHLNAQGISMAVGAGRVIGSTGAVPCSASEKNPSCARGRERKHPCFFLDHLARSLQF